MCVVTFGIFYSLIAGFRTRRYKQGNHKKYEENKLLILTNDGSQEPQEQARRRL